MVHVVIFWQLPAEVFSVYMTSKQDKKALNSVSYIVYECHMEILALRDVANRQVAAFMRADFLVCIQSSDAVAFDVRFIMYPLFQLMELSPQCDLISLGEREVKNVRRP
jgi:hypothetical protein